MRLRLLALALAAGIVAALAAVLPGAMGLAEDAVGDFAWRLGATRETERRVVVVDIDERAIEQEGPWPWPRATVAKLSQRLREAGVAVQAFDIVFPEPKTGDDALRAVWAGAPVVLGQIFSLDPAAVPDIGVPVGAVGSVGAVGTANAACPAGLPESSGVVANAAGLASADQAAGHFTPRVEQDGVIRKVPALICHQGRLYSSLALSALARATGASKFEWQLHDATSSGNRYPAFLAPRQWLTSSVLPGMVVPLDGRGDVRVPYGVQREAWLSVSAADLLAGRADTRPLRGTVALIGATAFGISDRIATPLAAVSSGVEVHAQLLSGLLDARVPVTPAVAGWLQLLVALSAALALLALATGRRSPPIKSLPLVGAGLALAIVGLSMWTQVRLSLWLPWSSAALFALLGATALAAAEHALTRAQRERLSAHLGAYLPGPVAQRLAAVDPTGRLQVDRREVSVLVADIRNFSAFATHRPPEETAAVLHAYCCMAVDVVERHGGLVENFVGDSVVAVWNAYEDLPNHQAKALAAARELFRETTELLASSRHEQTEVSVVQPLALGIGLESGNAIVGSFGPTRRRAHAALGEAVSVAVRLQSMTQDLSLPILIGPHMAAALPANDTVAQGEYLIEGLSRHCELYAPTAWGEWVAPDAVWVRSAATSAGDAESGTTYAASRSLGSPARAFNDL